MYITFTSLYIIIDLSKYIVSGKSSGTYFSTQKFSTPGQLKYTALAIFRTLMIFFFKLETMSLNQSQFVA